jgi:CheY-like chemotaxis protein
MQLPGIDGLELTRRLKSKIRATTSRDCNDDLAIDHHRRPLPNTR